MTNYLGEGGRLAGGPAPELVAAGFAAEIAQARRLAPDLSASDLAHAIALSESGSIDAGTAAALLRGLLELDAIEPDRFPWNPSLGDAFNSREHELSRRVGPAAAGWLSAGRPRREAFRVALRLVARRGVVALCGAQLNLAEAVVDQAARHADDLAADYTYLQPAQPSTIGHLLLAYAFPALRDAERLRELFARLDRSPAGVGGSAGSRWPLDRGRMAELLGFSALAVHSKDAMWQADVYVECVSAIAIALPHQSQLAQDLEILASQEFGAVELDDAHSRASALMPQKKNPYGLAVIRAAAATAAGDVAAALTALHTGSARTDHFHLLNGVVPRLLDEAEAVTRLSTAVVAGVRIDPAAAARAAREGFTVAADVADVVAQEAGIDYRAAHKLVGRAVRDLLAERRPPADLTSGRLADTAEEALGRRVTVPTEALAAALDPARCILARPQPGSCAPGEVDAMIGECRVQIAAGREWVHARARRAEEAEWALRATARRRSGPPTA